MKIELLNGFTRVNPQDTANVYNLEGRSKGRRIRRRIKKRPTAETRERMMARASRQAQRMKEPSLVPMRMDKATQRARMEERARVGNKRMNPQQMLRGFDSNYFLKDNAIYSDTELLQFPGAGLLAKRALKKRSGKTTPGGVPVAPGQQKGKAGRRARRRLRKLERQGRKDMRRDDRQEARRTKRTDRQEARRKRQEQRQAMRLARSQARQDRKLAQTQARQQDNILKAQAKSDAISSGQTFGQKVGDFFGNVGEGASQLLANNPDLRAGIFENVEDITGVDAGQFFDDTQSGADIQDQPQSFFDKYKIPIIIGGLGIGAFLLTRKKK